MLPIVSHFPRRCNKFDVPSCQLLIAHCLFPKPKVTHKSQAASYLPKTYKCKCKHVETSKCIMMICCVLFFYFDFVDTNCNQKSFNNNFKRFGKQLVNYW